ncbi:MAG: cell division ATP-binding protein FtsE [Candidatus Pacebacteria bacterium]|nr:cell division ATP-binding protein FtsE [Candidatus Paceibacterota bacterium]
MIALHQVSKIYSSRQKSGPPTIALDNVSFSVDRKEFVSLVGRSGAGKTTLLKLIIAEERPTKGKIFFDSKDISKLKRFQIPYLRRKVGVVFQDYKLFPKKTTYENIAYVLEIMGKKDEEISWEVSQVLEIVGLKNRAYNFPSELSGGEKQRVAIARALVHRPDVILADEPTGNLDPYNTFEIIRLLNKIYEMGTTVILATHDRELINILKKRVITLEEGKVIRDEQRGRFIL